MKIHVIFLIYHSSWVHTNYISAGALYGDIVDVVWGDQRGL